MLNLLYYSKGRKQLERQNVIDTEIGLGDGSMGKRFIFLQVWVPDFPFPEFIPYQMCLVSVPPAVLLEMGMQKQKTLRNLWLRKKQVTRNYISSRWNVRIFRMRLSSDHYISTWHRHKLHTHTHTQTHTYHSNINIYKCFLKWCRNAVKIITVYQYNTNGHIYKEHKLT